MKKEIVQEEKYASTLLKVVCLWIRIRKLGSTMSQYYLYHSKIFSSLTVVVILGFTIKFKYVGTLKLNDNIACILLVNATMYLFLIKITKT